MTVRVQGVDVFVRDQGGGPPILFLHGNPDSADVWDGLVARLCDRYRCIAIDLPGFGRSVAPSDFDCSIENLGRFVADLLSALGIEEPIHLVAHDMGGAYASAFAAMHPERLCRLVFFNHACFIADYRWHFWARIWRTPIMGELSMLAMSWPAFYASMRIGARKLTKEQMRHAFSLYTPATKRMVLRLYRRIGPKELRAWEPRMLAATARVPTLVLWGQQDPFVPPWVADRFGAERVVRFEESGHWVPAEVPGEAATEVRAFLGP